MVSAASSTFHNTIASSGLIQASDGGILNISGALTNLGKIEANAGTVHISASVAGNGSLEIANKGMMVLGTPCAEDVTFSGTGDTLVLAQPWSFTGKLIGLVPGDVIDLALTEVASTTISNSTLFVHEANDQTLSFKLASSTNIGFTLESDGAGGTNLIVNATLSPFMSDAVKNSHDSLTTLSGMSEANSTVSVLDGNKLLGTATADNFGNWSLQANITGTVHKFSETATDLAGNTGDSAGVTVYSPSANKTLIGGSGNDFLIAGPKDTLTGGAGNDAFVFNANFGKVVVSDFDINHDVLWLSNAPFAHDTIAQVLSQTHDTTAGAVIAVDAHDTITLHGVTVAQLAAHPSDFHFF